MATGGFSAKNLSIEHYRSPFIEYACVFFMFVAGATTLGNIGPGLGALGPINNFAHLPVLSKWILTACMLFGRLEIYTLLILLLFPEFRRK
jgi:trk system potassium uptake protein TrkH